MESEHNLRKSLTIKLNGDSLAILLFVMFYSMPFFRWVVENIFGLVSLSSFARPVILIVMYSLAALLVISNRKYSFLDFLLLLGLVVIFFALTYLFHPEYEFVYFREYYGVLPYVLRPDNGLYAYFFIRLLNEPRRLYKGLRISGYIMMAYSLVLLLFALRRGFWNEENYLGQSVRLSYSLNFGYNLVLPICTFAYGALYEKRKGDFFIVAIGVVMVLLGGSRGPFLALMVFGVLYILMSTTETKHKIRNILLILIIGLFLFIYYRSILSALGSVLNSLHISSRTLDKLIQGSISEDNGRSVIWLAAINMIRENIFGYGAMGARHVLYHIHNVGHPHSFFLEIIIDYGVILGPILLAIMFIGSIKILFSKKYDEWRWVYLLFLAQACTLLTSYTYWHSTGIWGALGVAVCVHKAYTYKAQKQRGLIHG